MLSQKRFTAKPTALSYWCFCTSLMYPMMTPVGSAILLRRRRLHAADEDLKNRRQSNFWKTAICCHLKYFVYSSRLPTRAALCKFQWWQGFSSQVNVSQRKQRVGMLRAIHQQPFFFFLLMRCHQCKALQLNMKTIFPSTACSLCRCIFTARSTTCWDSQGRNICR